MSAAVAEVAAIGAGVGLLGGLFGAGGAAVATPLLAAVGVPPIVAVAAPLPATIPTTLAAAFVYRREGLRRRRAVRYGGYFGVPATVVGALLTRWIDGLILVVLTDLLVIALGLRVVLARPRTVAPPPNTLPRRRLAAVTVAVGLVAGLLATAGGTLLAPLYMTLFRLPVKVAFATSFVVAAMLAVPGTVVHVALGHVDWRVVAALALGALPASALGARVAVRVATPPLTRAYGVVLCGLGAVLLVLLVVR